MEWARYGRWRGGWGGKGRRKGRMKVKRVEEERTAG
jgi:hypothetical protein